MIYHLKAYGLLLSIKGAVRSMEHIALETCILAVSGILTVCILLRHFCSFPQRVVHGVVDKLINVSNSGLYVSMLEKHGGVG